LQVIGVFLGFSGLALLEVLFDTGMELLSVMYVKLLVDMGGADKILDLRLVRRMSMHTQEQRQKAVELFLETGSYAAVINALGYGSRWSIERWVSDFERQGFVKESRTKWFKFTEEQKRDAVEHFLENGRNISLTARALGYPSRALLSLWIDELAPGSRKKRKDRIECSLEQKVEAVAAFYERDATARQAAIELGADRVTLYNWRNELLGEEAGTIMSGIYDEQLSDDIDSLREQKAVLERELYHAKLELALRKGAIEIVKKDPGANLEKLTNKEKAILIDALRPETSLNDLLRCLNMAKSSYYYQRDAIAAPDKYASLRVVVRNEFEASDSVYGYRRVYGAVRAEGTVVSEKVVRRIMAQEGLVVITVKKQRKYSSYKGEISPEVENIVKRDFHADAPNTKWLTDLTEFHIPAGKAYLSPIIDCIDGAAVSWTIGTSPNAELANASLGLAIETLREGEHPLVHSDRGCHYRWPGWIERMDGAGLTRSMSKKGCSPDNSACEGFFGRLKNEFFYGRSWQGVGIDEFIAKLDRYLHWYNEARIKESLGYLSPMQYRQSLGLAA
jgi:transposase InsO family protein/transposase-like protein